MSYWQFSNDVKKMSGIVTSYYFYFNCPECVHWGCVAALYFNAIYIHPFSPSCYSLSPFPAFQRVKHHNILQLVDAFETKKEYFLFLELWVLFVALESNVGSDCCAQSFLSSYKLFNLWKCFTFLSSTSDVYLIWMSPVSSALQAERSLTGS